MSNGSGNRAPPPLPLTAQPRTLTQQPEERWNEQAEPDTQRWPGFAGPWLQMYIQHLYITFFCSCFRLQQQDGIVWLVNDVLDFRDVYAIV